ncbi:MAG TPA: ABC transporter permease [Vicinamibacterales bacterium]|nr:ABC transporter permease [Acidobacteriota bacterium]HOC18357.1 ABC transporter permease [Vicinamibacterales bacterium]
MTDRGGAFHPVIELTLARLREFLREPEALFWVVFFPVLLAFALGLAFSRSGEPEVHVGLVPGPGDARVREALLSAPGLVVHDLSREAADRALRDGEVALVVRPGSPPGYRFDAAREESRLARLAVDAALQRAAGREDRFEPRIERVEIPGSRYVDWVIPGLLGMNIMGTGMWALGYAVVYARSRRLLKRLAATPMSRAHYLAAQMLARLVFLGLEVGALLLFARFVLDVPIAGSLVLVAAVSLLGALSFAGLGMLVASRARTIEAVSGWMNFTMVPMWVLSGVFFSSAHFPNVTQPLINALPLTALIDALRAVMLDGAGFGGVAGEAAILAAWTVGCFALALRLFRWQ